MLPPFVPPSVRQSQAELPLITQFIVEQTERLFGSVEKAAVGVLTSHRPEEQADQLPLITQFLVVEQVTGPVGAPAQPAQEPVTTESEASRHPIEQLPPEEGATAAGWIEEERDAFDWQGIASLATKQNEEEQAADEWASTNWDTTILATDHVASILVRIAKKVQKGELTVDAERGMSPEAILAATLSALLRSDG